MAITREQLIQLLLVEHLTEAEAAEKLGVHRNTITRAKKTHDINIKDWWKYQKLYCTKCNKELDPHVEMDANTRKKLIKSTTKVCNECKEKHDKFINREKQARWRENNRDEYNAYMREWRKKNKERWKEIKQRSKENNSQ
jgi:RNase P subunit RPR2